MAVTGGTIKKLRMDAGLTQRRLAELASVSQAHIAKIEQGKVDPRLSTVNKIMTVLTEGRQKKCRDIMTRGVFFAKPNDTVLKVSEVLLRHAISQMPVFDGKKVIGTVTEENIIRNLRVNLAQEKVRNVMDKPLPIVQEDANVDAVRPLLEKNAGVFVAKGSKIVGIIARSDLLKTIG
ncbi:MAG: CBS domain-containing protein [Candidatus Bathyarchaeia archaeon]